MDKRPVLKFDSENEYEYATEQELLDFANAVRQAGGGDVIESLVASTPGESRSCLIANALNFGCRVDGAIETWFMHTNNPSLADRIALGVPGCRTDPYLPGAVLLPRHIGAAAAAFDRQAGWTAKYVQKGA